MIPEPNAYICAYALTIKNYFSAEASVFDLYCFRCEEGVKMKIIMNLFLFVRKECTTEIFTEHHQHQNDNKHKRDEQDKTNKTGNFV